MTGACPATAAPNPAGLVRKLGLTSAMRASFYLYNLDSRWSALTPARLLGKTH